MEKNYETGKWYKGFKLGNYKLFLKVRNGDHSNYIQFSERIRLDDGHSYSCGNWSNGCYDSYHEEDLELYEASEILLTTIL